MPDAPAMPVVPPWPVTPMQMPFMQLWPLAHARLHAPQFALLVLVSTQPDPHSICPAREQPHAPALHTAPAGQVTPQPPQLSGSFPFVTAQLPLGHIVVPGSHIDAHVPPLQTSPVLHAFVQLPQWLLSDETQAPLQTSAPAWQAHAPFWQVWPAPQVLPHTPQFCGSDATFTHCEPQVISPAAQVGTPLPPVPVGLELTFPSQPSSDAIVSVATIGKIQAFIATTFRTSIRTRPVSVAPQAKMREIIRK